MQGSVDHIIYRHYIANQQSFIYCSQANAAAHTDLSMEILFFIAMQRNANRARPLSITSVAPQQRKSVHKAYSLHAFKIGYSKPQFTFFFTVPFVSSSARAFCSCFFDSVRLSSSHCKHVKRFCSLQQRLSVWPRHQTG